MARHFAVIMGQLAFTVTLVRCWWHQYDFTANVPEALLVMVLFALLGAVIGGTADWILADSLRQDLTTALELKEKS
jgi:hypothetical protein